MAAEYREGAPEASFVSTEIDGILKRLSDDGQPPRFAIQAKAVNPSVDTKGVGKRGIEGKFTTRLAAVCN